MTPAIFVPATFDYTQPRPSHSSGSNGGTARVDRALAELEDHMNAVKRNISTIILQQARKVELDAAAQELAYTVTSQGRLPPPRSKRLPPTRADEDVLIRNLEAPRVPERQYGVRPDWGPHEMLGVAPHPKDTPREAAVVQMMDLMRFGSLQLEGYERHCEIARKETRAQVAREIAEDLAKGLRTEAGEGAAPVTLTDDVPMNID